MTDLSRSHDAHDRLRISALVAGDLDGAERGAAEEQVRSCGECARLAADLRTLSTSLASMTVPPRPRDFRLSQRDLGGNPARRWSMDGIRGVLRPAGTALAALGVAGLLLAGTTALGGLASFGSSGAAAPAAAAPGDANFEARPSGGAAGAAASPAAAPAASGAVDASGAPVTISGHASSAAAPSPAAPGVLAAPSASPSAAAGGAATADKSADQSRQAGPIPAPAPPAGPSPLVIASVALLAAGIGFLVASRFLRPRGDRTD